MNKLAIKERLQLFLMEDIGEGDLTSQTVIATGKRGQGNMVAKEAGVMAGGEIVRLGYQCVDEEVEVTIHVADGEPFQAGDILVSMKGSYLSLLAGERVLLNIFQRMCGIATMARDAVLRLDDPSIRICDTRKTTPGLRIFEKYAVRCGGGFNHRFGLSDAILLKENHLLAGGGITKTLQAVKEKVGHMVKVEVETTNEEEVLEAVEAGADVIMFDNATPEEIASYVKLVPSVIKTEASGNISLETIASYRGCGVDYLSLGCLTHSVKAKDISFLLEAEGE
ncbi:carboxylating nicotinate-nucleotide diphosphorylase [Alkalihalobacillus oceani]|uniref:Probable nicotinate-nucleotide pyrophosphorylase [carboxylating] n=1 Tax=Halalkalibacter oceani TaxID=1653776 RepID=A0A9X2ILB1_9BACI|nr:carboxylating nicotinate-nucleotide diphosphorylase [Halalkalibacter oceani]MCM3712669.1 carboxylating nicotinate-nucleotide diphosphorylase [Halalkalibacter oceani]